MCSFSSQSELPLQSGSVPGPNSYIHEPESCLQDSVMAQARRKLSTLCSSSYVEEWQIIGTLGTGSQGSVLHVQSKTPKLSFAKKQVRIARYDKPAQSRLQNEIRVLQKLMHPHIVHFLFSYREDTSRVIYSTLSFPVGQGNLQELLELEGGNESDNLPKSKKYAFPQWFSCLASALAYMRTQGVWHHDIKPSNIIYYGDLVLFTDFGSASEVTVADRTWTENPPGGTARYSSPEVNDKLDENYNFHKNGDRSEIFSLGCVFAEMLTVLDGRRIGEFHRFLLRQDRQDRQDYHLGAHTTDAGSATWRYSDRLVEVDLWFQQSDKETTRRVYGILIQKMLHRKREARPSLNQLLEILQGLHPWTSACKCQPTYFD